MAGLARDRIHQVILNAFIDSGLSKADLARRSGIDKSRLSKILNTSSNVTAETLGQLLFAIDGSCPTVARNWPLRDSPANFREPEWFADCVEGVRIKTTGTLKSETNPVATSSRSTFISRETRNMAYENA